LLGLFGDKMKKDIIMTFIIIFLVMYGFVITLDYNLCSERAKNFENLCIKRDRELELKRRECHDLSTRLLMYEY